MLNKFISVKGSVELPPVDIKKYKSCKGMEGEAFSCELWMNGVLAAYVRNDGNGGETHFEWDNTGGMSQWYAWIAGLECYELYAGKMAGHNDDTAFDKLLAAMDFRKRLRRMCKKELVWRCVGDKVESYRSIIDKIADTPENRSKIMTTVPNLEGFYNDWVK